MLKAAKSEGKAKRVLPVDRQRGTVLPAWEALQEALQEAVQSGYNNTRKHPFSHFNHGEQPTTYARSGQL